MASGTERIWQTASAALLGKPELSGTDVAQLSGVPRGQAGRFWQALGFPAVGATDAVFSRKDAEVMRYAAHLFTKHEIDAEVLLQMTRVTGRALSRIANMHALSMGTEITRAVRAPDLSEAEVADTIAEIAEEIVHRHEPFLTYIWRRHLLTAISQTVASAHERAGEGETGAVGFADLVGFTALSQSLTEAELARVVERFEAIVYQHVPDRGGRVIKMLGDEVMFSHRDAHAVSVTALALAEACEADDLVPQVRVGVAFGPMLAWEGDLFGRTVNLASRLVGVARPGTVLVSAELAALLKGDEAFVVREIRDVKLDGIGKTRPWVLRRPESR